MLKLSSKELSTFLGSIYTNAKMIDKMKIIYRPYICPLSSLIKECSPSKSVLDIGCGSGQFLLLLSKYTPAKKLGGIEISQRLVTNAKALLKNQKNLSLTIEKYDGENIPNYLSEYETITLIDVFHHLKRKMQKNYISEIYKKMNSGSKFIFKDINASHPFILLNKIHDLFLGGGIGNEISITMAKKLLTEAGFQVLSISKETMVFYPHYTIICKK